MSADTEVLLRLPADLRDDLKEPLGPIHGTLGSWYDDLEGPVVAVGDVVSYHCEGAGRPADAAIIDGRTQRSAVDPDIEEALAAPNRDSLHAVNPAATITRSLLVSLTEAIDRPEPTQIVVEGEEDLATLPAVLALPDGAHVLYGQPDEGVVHVEVDEPSRARARTLLAAMEGDVDEVRRLVGD